MADVVREQMLEQRRILVSGFLDRSTITTLSAQLMTLDGASSRTVDLVLNSGGGPMSEIFAALDVIQLMRAKVDVTCIGSATGTAAALLACGSGQRRAARHATISLRYDEVVSFEGTTSDLARRSEQATALRTRYLDVLAVATGHDRERLAEKIERGRPMDVGEALELGLLDAVVGDEPRRPS